MIVERQSAFRTTLDQLPLLVIIWLMVVPGVLARATRSTEVQEKYLRTRFGIEQGLYSDQVDDIVQSPDGLLWLRDNGTDITRFDGQHFDSSTKLGDVMTMAIAPNGDLWVGTRDGLRQIRAGDLNLFGHWPLATFSLGPDYSAIVVLRFTRDGVLWVGASNGLFRVEHGQPVKVIPGIVIDRIEEEANGNLWLTTSEGAIEWDGTRVLPHPELKTELGVNPADIYHVFEDSHGVTWFCTPKGVARRVGGTTEKLQPWGPRGHQAFRVYEDPRRRIWFAKREGLFQLTATGLELVAPDMNVRQMYGDHDGNLWVSTNGDGLYRFKDLTSRTYTKADGLPGNVVMTVLASHDGSIWAGFNCGGIAHFAGHGFRIYNERDGLLNACVWSLSEDAKHNLWIGTWGGGVFRFREGRFTQYSKGQGLPGDVVHCVLASRDGSVWLSSGSAVSQIRDGQIRNYTEVDGLPSAVYTRVFEDRTGGIWVGSYKGIEHLVGGRFEQVTLPGKVKLALMGDDTAGAVYFTASSPEGELGTYRLANDETIQVASGLGASEMRETKQGDLWTFSPSGVMRFPLGSLNHAHGKDDPLDLETFGSSDGLPVTQPSDGNPISAQTHDGKLWIATNQGLTYLDLPHMPGTERKPTIYMEGITEGRSPQSPSQGLVLPAGTHHLELNFNSIELTAPEKIRLQYRMDDVDSEWLDAKPLGHAVYSTLPPGTHAFHIRSCNRSGIWDRAGVVYSITQQPYFYQTRWFLAATSAFGLLLIAVLYQLRMRRVEARVHMRLEERVAERTRIARDLHDTLLQSFQGAVFQFQAARKLLLRNADNAMQVVDEAIQAAEEGITEGRTAIQDLRPEPASQRDLPELLKSGGHELADSHQWNGNAPTVGVIVEGTRQTLPPMLQDEVYRISREVIRNAFAHAVASHIEVEIRYDQDQLRVRIRDNGKGIDPKILEDGGQSGHWGISGMRERAQRIGAQVAFWSEVGAGTEVQLTVPGAIAYKKHRDGHRFRLFRRADSDE